MYIKRSSDSLQDIVINNHFLTGDIYCYRAKLEVGGTIIDGDTITTTTINSYSDIRADGGFIGNGLFITDVKGNNAHEIFKWAKNNHGKSAIPKWNFHKILINKDGKIEDTYSSFTSPMSEKITSKIEKLL